MQKKVIPLKISESGVDFIKKQEGFRSSVYKCAGGADTIGYGTTNADAAIICVKIKPGLTCTKEQADKWLRAAISKKYAPAVDKYTPTYHWTQEEFDALVSFEYNLGMIDKLTANGTRSKSVIAAKLLEYNKAGGKPNDGLTARREAERKMFLSAYAGALRELPVLRRGDHGNAVSAAQKLLNASGISQHLNIDGRFGEATNGAVRAFQTAHGLEADGIIGALTWAELTK